MATTRSHYLIYYYDQNEPEFEVFAGSEGLMDSLAELLIDAYPNCRVSLGPISGPGAIRPVAKQAHEVIVARIQSGDIESTAPAETVTQ